MLLRKDIAAMYVQHGYAVYARCCQLMGSEGLGRQMAKRVFLQVLNEGKVPARPSSVHLFQLATRVCLAGLRHNSGSKVAPARGFSNRCARLAEEAHVMACIHREASLTTAEIARYHLVDGLAQNETCLLTGLSWGPVSRRLRDFAMRARRLWEAA